MIFLWSWIYMNLTKIFTDSCEVILYKGQWIYPIFKCGWNGFQKVKEQSLYNDEIKQCEKINVFIRDPLLRWRGGINKYSQLNNIENDDIVRQIENDKLVDKHWLPQYFWIMHLSKFYDGDIQLLPMSAIPHSRKNETPNKKPVRTLKDYGKEDNVLLSMCNSTYNIKEVLNKVKNVLS